MSESQLELLDGVEVRIGRQTYIMPPLPLKPLRTMLLPLYADAIKMLDRTEGQSPEEIMADVSSYNEKVVAVIHAALKRNYPDLTPDQIEEEIDLETSRKLLEKLREISGLKPVGGTMPGEVPEKLNGETSMPISSPAPDGPGIT